MTPEGRVKKEIKQYLDSIGAYYFMPVQTGYGVRGTPDFLICHLGRFIAVEAKAPGGKVMKFQTAVLDQIRQRQGIAIVAQSAVDVAKVIG